MSVAASWMSLVEVIDEGGTFPHRPFRVKVNGEFLVGKNGRFRCFGSSFTAALAGAKEIDKSFADNGKESL